MSNITSPFRRIFLLLGLLVALGLGAREAGALELTARKASGYVIVGDQADPAVRDLQFFLWRISGAQIPIVPLNVDPLPEQAIVVGMRFVSGYAPPLLPAQGFNLRVVGKRLVIRGGSPVGLQHGIYGFLDALGCRWLTPEVEQIPARETIVIPDTLDVTQIPSIRDRGHIGGDFGDAGPPGDAWRRRNRVNATLAGGAYGNLYELLPPATYYAEHPDWYPLDAFGDRLQDDPHMGLCWTNEAMLAELTRLARVEMGKSPATRLISLSRADAGHTPCLCPACRALVGRYGSESAPLIAGLNKVLAETKKSHRNHCVVALVAPGRPPVSRETGERLASDANLYLEWVREGDALRGMRAETNAPLREEFQEWAAYTKNLRVWSRAIALRGPTVPFPNYRAMAEDIAWFAPHVTGFRHQGATTGGVDFGQMRGWVYARMMWNAGADAAALQEEFVRAYYGDEAAKPLLRYLRGAQQRAAESAVALTATASPEAIVAALYPRQQLAADLGLFTQAVAAADATKNAAYAAHARQTLATSLAIALYYPPAPLDPVIIDKKRWLLPGGNAELAPITDFIGEALRRHEFLYHLPPWHGRETFLSRAGGRIEPDIENNFIRVGFCANLGGMICSLYDKVSGRELLAMGSADDPARGGIRDGVGMGVRGGGLNVVTRKNLLLVNHQAIITTNPWVETPCLQQHRQVQLPADRRGFSVSTWLYATPALAEMEKAYPDPLYRLSSTEPIYAGETVMRWKVSDPAAARVVVAAKSMTREHAFRDGAVFRVPMPVNRPKDESIRCFLLTGAAEPVILLNLEWAALTSLRFTLDAERKEVLVTAEGMPRKAVVNESVPLTTYSVDVLSPVEAARLMPVTGVRAEASDRGVTLSWSARDFPELAEYRVYSSTSATGKYTQVATVPPREHGKALTGLTNGRRVYYRVTMVDRALGESLPSPPCNPIPGAAPRTTFLVANDGRGDYTSLQEAFNALPTAPWTRDITLQVQDTGKVLPEGYDGGVIPEAVIAAAAGRRLILTSTSGNALIAGGIDLNGARGLQDEEARRLTVTVSGFLFSRAGDRGGCALEAPGSGSLITGNEFVNWGTAIGLQNAADNAGTVIDRNYFHRCDAGLADGGGGLGGAVGKPFIVRNSVFEEMGRGVEIARPAHAFVINNTFLHIRGHALRVAPEETLTIANNLFVDVRRAAYALAAWKKADLAGKALAFDYNLFYQSAIVEFADGIERRLEILQASLPIEARSITGDPLLHIPGKEDDAPLGHIVPEGHSSAVNAGKLGLPYGDEDFFGNPRVRRSLVDIGACEAP